MEHHRAAQPSRGDEALRSIVVSLCSSLSHSQGPRGSLPSRTGHGGSKNGRQLSASHDNGNTQDTPLRKSGGTRRVTVLPPQLEELWIFRRVPRVEGLDHALPQAVGEAGTGSGAAGSVRVGSRQGKSRVRSRVAMADVCVYVCTRAHEKKHACVHECVISIRRRVLVPASSSQQGGTAEVGLVIPGAEAFTVLTSTLAGNERILTSAPAPSFVNSVTCCTTKRRGLRLAMTCMGQQRATRTQPQVHFATCASSR